ncbi:MAG: hypothetical protein LBJ61_02425 [Deltaproteobacteria bacterium]|nr:hypothetical protein [Deltaproteobacteria bacterium]
MTLEDFEERLAKLENQTPPGTFLLLPFRVGNLPFGVYYANGDLYPLTSTQGIALNSLPSSYKTDWAIVTSGDNINLPNLFAADGRGYFPRVGSVPGVEQGDAIRNFSGMIGANINIPSQPYVQTGPFYFVSQYPNTILSVQSSSGCNYGDVYMNPSRVVPTATENRPINKSLVPGVWLGV